MAPEKPNIKCAQPYFPPKEIEWITSEIRLAIEAGTLTQGAHISQFEDTFAQYTGTKYAIAVSNGTTALEIILRHFSLNGGEVIVPTNTFLASANAVIFAGGVPVFSDISRSTLCIDLPSIQKCVSPKTRGVMIVHIAGMICPETDVIKDYCKRNGFFCIEDSAHAHGAKRNGQKSGSLCDAAAFSFFPTKPITTAEGGMITTNLADLAGFARTFRNHGVPEGSTVHEQLGHNYRMDELSAILGISQIRMLDQFITIRKQIAREYEEGLADLKDEGICTVLPKSNMQHSYYKFPILLPTVGQRNTVSKSLREEYGVDTGTVYWPPCHLQPVVELRPDLYVVRGDLTASEDVLPRVLCLPIHARLTNAEVAQVIEAVHQAVAETRV